MTPLSVLRWKRRSDRRAVKVRLDQQHLRPGARKGGGETDRAGRLPFGGGGARDQERTRHLAVAAGDGQGRAQSPKLVDRVGRELVPTERTVVVRALFWDSGQDGKPVAGPQLLLSSQTRIEVVDRVGDPDAEHEACQERQTDREDRTRPGGRGRWLRLILDLDRRVPAHLQALELRNLRPEGLRRDARRRRIRLARTERRQHRLDSLAQGRITLRDPCGGVRVARSAAFSGVGWLAVTAITLLDPIGLT